jgi:hypothetical protein
MSTADPVCFPHCWGQHEGCPWNPSYIWLATWPILSHLWTGLPITRIHSQTHIDCQRQNEFLTKWTTLYVGVFITIFIALAKIWVFTQLRNKYTSYSWNVPMEEDHHGSWPVIRPICPLQKYSDAIQVIPMSFCLKPMTSAHLKCFCTMSATLCITWCHQLCSMSMTLLSIPSHQSTEIPVYPLATFIPLSPPISYALFLSQIIIWDHCLPVRGLLFP